MTAVKVRILVLEAHLSARPEFTKLYGAKVRAAGGDYNDMRGNADTRYLKLPFEHRALADEICAAFPKGRQTVLIARGLEVDGISRERVENSFGRTPGVIVHYWDPKSGQTATSSLESHISRGANKFDWAHHITLWEREDAAAAARRHQAALLEAVAQTKDEIAHEAKHLLDGRNDLGPLLALAQRLRDLEAEAAPRDEAVPERPRLAPAPGF